MKKYVYYACGNDVESVKFESNAEAWEYVLDNSGYDCVVERMEIMKNDRHLQTAIDYNILDKVNHLESDLLKIESITEVEFDLDGFYDNLKQVTFLVKYDIDVARNDYYDKRHKLVQDVLDIVAKNGLEKTEDRIEDYGEHLYFVTRYNGKEW